MRCFPLFGLLILLCSPPLGAEAQKLEAQISIRVIYSVKDQAASIDPQLEDIRDELKELPATKFRLLDKIERRLELNTEVELQLPGDNSISVKFQGADSSGSQVMLHLEVAIKPAVKIHLRLASGGRTLLGGPRHLEGKLVLDVSARLAEENKP